jgi:prepilin-type N-terminal cleavage/methylation domain-containing protein
MGFRSGLKFQRGFSLVELMVALVIGLVIVLGAGQLFLMGVNTFRQVERISERQEALRAISDIISFDIRSSSRVLSDAGDDQLELEYFSGARKDDIYCGLVDDLARVLYRFEEGEGLYMQYSCGDTPLDLSPSELIVSSISSASFEVGDNYVDVFLGFFPLHGSSSGESVFNFKVAIRNAVISRL